MAGLEFVGEYFFTHCNRFNGVTTAYEHQLLTSTQNQICCCFGFRFEHMDAMTEMKANKRAMNSLNWYVQIFSHSQSALTKRIRSSQSHANHGAAVLQKWHSQTWTLWVSWKAIYYLAISRETNSFSFGCQLISGKFCQTKFHITCLNKINKLPRNHTFNEPQENNTTTGNKLNVEAKRNNIYSSLWIWKFTSEPRTTTTTTRNA